jgi:hypothetical protein
LKFRRQRLAPTSDAPPLGGDPLGQSFNFFLELGHLLLRARHLERHKQQKHGGIWFLISSASDFQINWIRPALVERSGRHG